MVFFFSFFFFFKVFFLFFVLFLFCSDLWTLSLSAGNVLKKSVPGILQHNCFGSRRETWLLGRVHLASHPYWHLPPEWSEKDSLCFSATTCCFLRGAKLEL